MAYLCGTRGRSACFILILFSIFVSPSTHSTISTSAQSEEEYKFEISKDYQLNGSDRTYIKRDFTITGIAHSERYLYLSIVWDTGPSGILILDHSYNYIKEIYLLDGIPFYPLRIDYHKNKLFAVGVANSTIIVFDEEGNFLTEFGEYGTGQSQFRDHQDISVNNQLIYVADTQNSRVQMFTHNGVYIDTTTEFIYNVGHVAAFGTGFFTTSSTTDPIHKFGLRGEVEGEFGSLIFRFGDPVLRTGPGEFNAGAPNGLAVSGEYMIVGDSPTSRIQVFDLFGNSIKQFYHLNENQDPFIIWDLEISHNKIYVVDNINKTLVIYNFDTSEDRTFDFTTPQVQTESSQFKDTPTRWVINIPTSIIILHFLKQNQKREHLKKYI